MGSDFFFETVVPRQSVTFVFQAKLTNRNQMMHETCHKQTFEGDLLVERVKLLFHGGL